MKKILVIEDDPLLMLLLVTTLEKRNYLVVKSTEGIEGMKLIILERPDMIITDLMLPGKSGYDIISFVKKTLDWETPIIVLSAIKGEDSVLKSYDFGADDFIRKPFSPKELIIRIENLFKCTQ